MTISGPQAMAALDEALGDIRREEDDVLRKLTRGLERAAKIRDAEGELLRQFAAGRLPPEQEAELGGGIVRAGLAQRQALAQNGTELAANAAHLAGLEASLEAQTAARAAALGDLDRQQAALRALSSRIAAAVARDPAYERQRQVVLTRKAVAAAVRTKLRQADIDRERKGRPYREDPLFSYLLARGFGTPAYNGAGLAVSLDAAVARLTGFERARGHYAVLNELPARWRAHADRLAVEAAAAEDELDELERQAIDAAGGGGIRAALAVAQAAIAAADEEVRALQETRDAAVAAQTRLTEADDAGFGGALLTLVRALGSPDVAGLIASARAQSPGVEDPLVVQLDDARRRVAEERTDSREQRARLATLAARRADLEAIQAELKARKFDDPRSLFRDDGLIGARLDGLLTGAIGADAYWAQWRAAQSWSAGTSDWGGGVGLPRHGRDAAESGAVPPVAGAARPQAAGAAA